MKPIAISSGDPSGIGPELILKAWLARKTARLPVFFAVADAEILRARAKLLGLDVKIQPLSWDNIQCDFNKVLPIFALENQQIDSIGCPNQQNAAGTIEAIRRSVNLIFNNFASSLVTCPIAKKPLYDAGFTFPGHTEYLSHLATSHTQRNYRPIMMLVGPELRTVPVTIHIPLSQISQTLNKDLIIETAQVIHHDLRNRFNITNPRIAVSGLNPHAGEGGSMGREEIDIIRPAIDDLLSNNIAISGPHPADTMFHKKVRSNYDVALCMYHDQALIPIKTIGFDRSVNATLGLPFVRTSPDHGTAFDIAGQNIASPESLIAAIKLADNMVKKNGN